MFTLAQIDALHARLGTAATLAEYVRALRDIGVMQYQTFISDGHSDYQGADSQSVTSPPVHDVFPVASKSNREQFLNDLKLHEQGWIGYLEMARRLADSGVEKWTVDTRLMTMTFYDTMGDVLLTEPI